MNPRTFVAAAAAAFLVAVAPAPAQAQLAFETGLETPGPLYSHYGPQWSGDVRCAIAWDPDGPGPRGEVVLFGGSFVLPSLGARNLAWFDPATQRFGAFDAQPDAPVRALAIGPDGSLYVGGDFAAVGFTTTGKLARWDGASWSAVGGGVTGAGTSHVAVLQVMPNGDLIVGGSFQFVGNQPNLGLARWDGSQWHQLGGTSFWTWAMALRPDGRLLVLGGFPGKVGEWDGSSWTTFWPGQPLLSTGSRVALLSDGRVVVSDPVLGLLEWNGTEWTTLGPSAHGPVSSLLRLPSGDLLAAKVSYLYGQPWHGTARYDGTNWYPFAPGGGSRFLCAMANGDVYSHADASPTEPIRGIGRWDGVQWRALGRGFDDPVRGLLALPNGDVLAFGRFRCAEGTATQYLARLVGQTWAPLPVPLFFDAPQPLCAAVDAQGQPWIGGSINSSPGPSSVYRWSAGGWVGVGSAFGTVTALAIDATGSPIAGRSAYPPSAAIGRWDGTTWQTLGAGLDGPVLAVLVRRDGTIVAGGEFLFSGSTAVSRIAQWNGSAWQPLGPGLDGPVRALAELPNGDLVAAGDFANDGTMLVPLGYVARFDGTAWHPFGQGLAGVPDASAKALLVLPDGQCIVGGDFSFAGGAPARNLARWDGAAWSEVDGGVDGVVLALAQRPDGEILVGGEFGNAGGRPAAFLARLRTDQPATAISYGVGCAGSAGLAALAAQTLPWLGATYRAHCTGIAANALGIEVLGLSALQQPLISVHPWAGTHCSLLASPDLLTLWPATAQGIRTQLQLPSAASLVGALFHQQLVVAEPDPAFTVARVIASNGIQLRIGAL